MMFTHSTQIAANPPVVWSVLSDLERWPEWTPTVRRLEILEGRELGIGLRVRIEQPRLRPAVWAVTECTPLESFTWVSRFAELSITASHLVEPSESGSKITLVLRYGGVLRWPVARIAGGITARYLQAEATGLRAKAEALRSHEPAAVA